MTIAHHIRKIEIRQLFGRYSYDLPSENESLGDLNIIYGENGLGKTTLLNLVFHLLSPGENKGHVELISKAKFESLTVYLNDGTAISAQKDPQLLVGPVVFRISGAQRPRAIEWKYSVTTPGSIKLSDLPANIDLTKVPKEVREQVTRALEQRRFFAEMSKLQATPLMLTSDRIFLTDAADPAARESRWNASPEARSRARLSEIIVEYRNEAVSESMHTASVWLQKKLLETSYGAGESTSGIYDEVVNRIANTAYKTSTGLSAADQIRTRLELKDGIEDILSRAKSFSEFGLARQMLSNSLASSVSACSGNKLNLINSVLKPHLAELKSRLDKIDPIYHLILSFVTSVNGFLNDKKLAYNVREGLKIFVESGGALTREEITPSQLSSGEKQLILIFCHVLTARNSTSVFIIDEPEISLNIVWQRMLVSALQSFAKGSEIQFIFASHSMEILAKHRDRVITLQESS
jgi:energy-coupling factor transporter ATP-binding protein EcfA2